MIKQVMYMSGWDLPALRQWLKDEGYKAPRIQHSVIQCTILSCWNSWNVNNHSILPALKISVSDIYVSPLRISALLRPYRLRIMHARARARMEEEWAAMDAQVHNINIL